MNDDKKQQEDVNQTLKAWHQPQCKKLSADNTNGKSFSIFESTFIGTYGPS